MHRCQAPSYHQLVCSLCKNESYTEHPQPKSWTTNQAQQTRDRPFKAVLKNIMSSLICGNSKTVTNQIAHRVWHSEPWVSLSKAWRSPVKFAKGMQLLPQCPSTCHIKHYQPHLCCILRVLHWPQKSLWNRQCRGGSGVLSFWYSGLTWKSKEEDGDEANIPISYDLIELRYRFKACCGLFQLPFLMQDNFLFNEMDKQVTVHWVLMQDLDPKCRQVLSPHRCSSTC